MDLIDLHVHTNISDGSFSPEEVVRYAIKKGLKAIAITDHDSMEGNERAKKEGDLIGLEVISGVEISAEFSYGTLHILGYFPWDSNNNMKERLIVLQKAREERNPLIVKKLQALGIQIEFDEVKKIAGYGQIGRPHFAKLLVEKGIVKDMDEAFDRFLKKGGPAYVDKFRFSPKQSINEIKKNKGIPVLAHPFTIDLDNDKLIKKIEEFVNYGLEGIEVFYPEHTLEQKMFYIKIAKRFNLLITGGSDFHGENKEGIDLGIGKGDLRVPYVILENLKKRFR